jgi:hypothetical protein
VFIEKTGHYVTASGFQAEVYENTRRLLPRIRLAARRRADTCHLASRNRHSLGLPAGLRLVRRPVGGPVIQ